MTRPHFDWSFINHCHLLAKNLNVKDILHDFILWFSLLGRGVYYTSTAVKSKSTGSTEFLNEELGEGDVLVCAQGLVAMFPVQHEVIFIVCICEKAKTEVTNTRVNHFLFPFLGRGDHSTNLRKPQRDIFHTDVSVEMEEAYKDHIPSCSKSCPLPAAHNWGRGEKANVSQAPFSFFQQVKYWHFILILICFFFFSEKKPSCFLTDF